MDHQKPKSRSIHTQLIIDRLTLAEPGEVVPYSDLNALTGKDTQFSERHYLTSAMRHMLSAFGRVFQADGESAGVGVQRLTNSQIIAQDSRIRRRIRRTAQRGIAKIETVEFDKLTHEEQVRHNTMIALLGVVKFAGSNKAMRRLMTPTPCSRPQLPTKDSLRSLMSKRPPAEVPIR